MAIAKSYDIDEPDAQGLGNVNANFDALFKAVDLLQEQNPNGYKIAAGETALDGSNPSPIETGLATVVAFIATLKGSAAPGLTAAVLTYTSSGGTVSVYAWKPTSSTNPTLIASTDTDTFGWVAIGT